MMVPEDGNALLNSGAGFSALVKSGAEFGFSGPNGGGQSLSRGEPDVGSNLSLSAFSLGCSL